MAPTPNRSAQAPRRTGPFGPAGEIVPRNQSIVKLSAEDSMLAAFERLCDDGFNQAPVVEGNKCLGVLRFFSAVQGLMQEQWFRDKLATLKVRNFVDLNPRYIGADDWVDIGFDWQQDDLALVGRPDDLKGIVTATDILRRLTDYAQAFVHLEAIEHDTRELLELALPLPASEDAVLAAFVEGPRPIKSLKSYDECEFWQYGLIFGRETTFARLQDFCIWDRGPLVNRLKRVSTIRNTLLHFRGRATDREVGELEQFARHAAAALARAHEKLPTRTPAVAVDPNSDQSR